MTIEPYIQILKAHTAAQKPCSEDAESILTLLYEAYSDAHRLDDAQIKADFNELYRLMNDMPLREMDQILYPVCTLCRDHERAGFIEGVRVGICIRRSSTATGAELNGHRASPERPPQNAV